MTNYALKKAIRVKKIPVEIDLEWVKDLKGIENTLEDPLIDVIELESKPPVQDSAKEIFSFFLLNNLTNF